MMPCRGMGKINPDKMPKAGRKSTALKKGGWIQDAHDRKDESLGSTKPRGWGKAARGWQGRYDSTKRQR